VGLFNEKDRMDGGKRMASNWEVILTPFLSEEIHWKFFYRRDTEAQRDISLYLCGKRNIIPHLLD